MGFIQRRLVKIVMRVVTYPKVTLAVCAMLLLTAVGYAWYGLSLSTDQDELLTTKLGFFRDYKEFTRKFPENESFVVIIEPRESGHPPAQRWIELADRMSAHLLALKDDVRQVHSHVSLDELGSQGLLFADWEEVRTQSGQAREFQKLVKILGEGPGIDALVLGQNTTVRFFRALAQGSAKDSRDFALAITRSLASALQKSPERWTRGDGIPNLAEADPRAAVDPSVYGYNMIPDETLRKTPEYKTRKILVINVYANRDYSSLADVTEPLKRMRAAVAQAAIGFEDFKPPVITGRPALEADEMATSDHDTQIAEILGLVLIFVVLLIFLRNFWLVIVAELCLGVGIGWTFGWATLAVGRLNLLSLVFVIALIGIGMDYLIQILTRYRFEKKRYDRPSAIWARVFRYVSPPISTACAGAAGAFLASTLTDFRGAAELGLIAGGGLLLCLAAGYTLLPALLTLLPAKVGEVPATARYLEEDRIPPAGGWRLIPGVLWIVIAIGGLFIALPPKFDSNLLKLQADGLPSVKAVRKLPLWYAVIVSDDLAKLRQAREAFTAPTGEGTTIDHTESLLDAIDKQAWLSTHNEGLLNIKWKEPPTPTAADLREISDAAQNLVSQWEKQSDSGDLTEIKRAVGELRNALRPSDAPLIVRLNAWQSIFLKELRDNLAQFAPDALAVERLPSSIREHLVGRDPVGAGAKSAQPNMAPAYALYIYPKADLWESGALERFVHEVERRTPQGFTLTGIAPQLFHSTQAIHHAFMTSTFYALIIIATLILLDLRKIGQTMLAISVLALGLPMLLLMMSIWRNWLHEPMGIPGSWNFANFFGLPILIGAGHEYGVFLVHRYRETLHDPRRVWRRWDVSDRALLLCAIVTSASFGFLIAARHHGLASLGWVMCVGTACIYLAGLLVLRPLLLWQLQRKKIYE